MFGVEKYTSSFTLHPTAASVYTHNDIKEVASIMTLLPPTVQRGEGIHPADNNIINKIPLQKKKKKKKKNCQTFLYTTK